MAERSEACPSEPSDARRASGSEAFPSSDQLHRLLENLLSLDPQDLQVIGAFQELLLRLDLEDRRVIYALVTRILERS